jgi:hypothetical protein
VSYLAAFSWNRSFLSHIHGDIDACVIGQYAAVGNCDSQSAAPYLAHADLVSHALDVWLDVAAEPDLADADGAAMDFAIPFAASTMCSRIPGVVNRHAHAARLLLFANRDRSSPGDRSAFSRDTQTARSGR